MTLQMFGGDWTEEKLARVQKYLAAYTKALSKQSFHTIYVDAFAGTGYRTLKQKDDQNTLLFPELAESEPVQFLDGSARIALRVEPRFAEYVFIEKNRIRFAELEKLKQDFPSLSNDIHLENEDANTYLASMCRKRHWRAKIHADRAVLFLDPFGTEVAWQTMEAIARTEAIDLWYLFPLQVNRLLKRDGNIDEHWRNVLNRVFGNSDWNDKFYATETNQGLFGEHHAIRKVVNTDLLSKYVVERLKSIFPAVAENPLITVGAS